MKPTLLRVTKQRIKDGDVCDYAKCPIARTLKTKWPGPNTFCGYTEATIDLVDFKTTLDVQKWMNRLFAGRTAPPITLRIDHTRRTIGIQKPKP